MASSPSPPAQPPKKRRRTDGPTMVNNGRNMAGGLVCRDGQGNIPQIVLDFRDDWNAARLVNRSGFPCRNALVRAYPKQFRTDGVLRKGSTLAAFAGDTRVCDGRTWSRLLSRGLDWVNHRYNQGAVGQTGGPAAGRATLRTSAPSQGHGDTAVAAKLRGAVYSSATQSASEQDHGDMTVAVRLRGSVYGLTVAQTSPADEGAQATVGWRAE
ncbi:hypothetical protein LTR56_009402 [Elasticomyces elasticus]|nr:hypothetical protein LTR56_009402 [Elasticomyces elasticus]KAK3645837.1 hypothetical protein LTR22_014502 [Elasticomyces elasticus]KAK4931076.1 hypothetical protein LTR49_002492 [Elasticomyces elasticus]KAK5765543.1 hypothetical protein LTS12_004295 [Elasticomyces elasticus]